MKAYEIIMQGAVEGGYVYAAQSIGLFETLDDAKRALEDGVELSSFSLDCWNSFDVFERTFGEFYGNDEPVYSINAKNVEVRFKRNEPSDEELLSLENLSKECDIPMHMLLREYYEGWTVEEIMLTYAG